MLKPLGVKNVPAMKVSPCGHHASLRIMYIGFVSPPPTISAGYSGLQGGGRGSRWGSGGVRCMVEGVQLQYNWLSFCPPFHPGYIASNMQHAIGFLSAPPFHPGHIPATLTTRRLAQQPLPASLILLRALATAGDRQQHATCNWLCLPPPPVSAGYYLHHASCIMHHTLYRILMHHASACSMQHQRTGELTAACRQPG